MLLQFDFTVWSLGAEPAAYTTFNLEQEQNLGPSEPVQTSEWIL